MATVSVLNTSSNLSGKTLVSAENPYTISGLMTFNRSPSAPFAVASGSAVVTNLDSDKLDGIEGAAFARLASNETVTGNWAFTHASGISVTNTLTLTGVTAISHTVTTAAGSVVDFRNSNAGAGAHFGLRLGNDQAAVRSALYCFSAAYSSGFAAHVADSLAVQSEGAGGISVLAVHASGGNIRFGTGASGTERMRLHASGGFSLGNTTDPSAGNALVTGSVKSNHATAGVGYGTGAGGTVTQATSKSTGVTLDKATGQITLNSASLAAGAIVSFTLTNAGIAAGDLILLNHASAGTVGAYTLNAQAGAGSAVINVRNETGGALAEAIVLGFAVIKAVTA